MRQITELDSAPTDLLWENDEHLSIACANGKLVTVSERIVPTAQLVNSTMKNRKSAVTAKGNMKPTNSTPEPKVKRTEMTDFDDSSDEEKSAAHQQAAVQSDDDDDLGTNDKPSPASLKPKKNRYVIDEAADDDDDDSINSTQHSPSRAAASGSPGVDETTFPNKDGDASDDDDYDACGRRCRPRRAGCVCGPRPLEMPNSEGRMSSSQGGGSQFAIGNSSFVISPPVCPTTPIFRNLP